ncbi:GNAT family N-acetyltransferase [Peribacillus sp. SCS-37]|uniref:GNAT family N-acetyltransferase n=1 Tax=Paraperibacillus esterisolvens TaxID=3115296 RepID=UPI00390689DD
MEIRMDDLTNPVVQELIREHLKGMEENSPPESIHALGIEKLKQPGVSFWCAWEGSELLGCGALKELSPVHGEVKSMRTSSRHLRKGTAKRLLQHILDECSNRGYKKVSLETGSMEAFAPARKLYENFGFRYCGPFAEYVEDPNSFFMEMELLHGDD